MSFETFEESVESGAPFALVKFQWGSVPAEALFYTDHDEPIIFNDGTPGFGAQTYQPIPMAAGDITTAGHLDDSVLTLQVPHDTAIAQKYKGNQSPNKPIAVTVRQGHIGDVAEDYPVKWLGRVVSAVREDYTTQISCEPAITGITRLGLRRHYQHGCPYELYGIHCKADKAAATINVAIASVGAEKLTFAAGWSGTIAPEKYIGGYVQWTDGAVGLVTRTIFDLTADELGVIVSGDVSELAPGNSVDVVLGCNHLESDCQNLHIESGTGNPNTVNYGGQNFIPQENPMTFVNRWY